MGSVLKLSGVLSQARVVSIHRKDHGTVLLGALQAVAEAGNEFSRHVTNANGSQVGATYGRDESESSKSQQGRRGGRSTTTFFPTFCTWS